MDYNNDDKSISRISILKPETDTLTIQSTGALQLPEGTTLQRPTQTNGMVRLNTETGKVEVSSGGSWIDIKTYAELPTGGIAGNVLIKNSATDYDAYFGAITADMAPYAKQLIAYVKNDTNATILKGTPVYQTGVSGSSWTILVRPADASNPAKMPAIGVLAQDLAAAATGDLIVLGEIRGVNTAAFTEGDEVYVAPGGGYTNVKPTGVNDAVQFLGIVTKIHETNGGGYVTGTGTVDVFRKAVSEGFEGWTGTQWQTIAGSVNNLDSLTDVTIAAPQDGQILQYSSGQWTNTSAGSPNSHDALTGRSLPDQHPISAITGLQTALDGKAAKGANTDITSLSGITGGISTADYLQLDTNATVTYNPGRISWNADDGTIDVALDSNVVLQVGQEQLLRVYNITTHTIYNGQVVMATGSDGSHMTVDLAQANTVYMSKATVGVATSDILPNSHGYVTTFGLVRGIDTSSLALGSILYLSATTAGGVTYTRPIPPNQVIEIGVCVIQDATNGAIAVRINKIPEVRDLNDTLITLPHQNNEFLVYDTSAYAWVNKQSSSVVSILGIDQKAPLSHTHSLSDLTQSGATLNQVATFNGTSWVPADHYIPTPTEVGTLATADIIPYVSTVYRDACGFPNRTDTSLSLNKSTRTVTLTPLNANACVYHFGTKYTLSTALSIVWSNTDGGRYISFDPTTQQLVESFSSPDIRGGQVLVAYVYWNSTSSYMVIGGDERHGSARELQWHYTQHRDVGAVWRSGGSITYTLNDPSTVTVGVSTPIMFADEDLDHTINHNSNPNFPTTLYEQKLNGQAWLPVVALIGTTYLEYPATSTLPWKVGTTRVQYNPVTNGSGALADATNNSYINYWLVATNDGEFPIKLIMGRTIYTTEADAVSEILSQYGLPFSEMAVMYRFTLHVNDTYTQNSAHVAISTVVNAYRTTTGGTTAISATTHDSLSNRNYPDQHPIGAITNLQTTLDSKQPTLISGTNIQTINGSSILTSGNLSLQPALVSGTNIKTIAGYSLIGSGNQPLILDDLADVVIATPTVGQTLTYNGTNWVNLGTSGQTNGGGAAKRIWSNNVPASSGTTVITPGTAAPLVTAGTQVWTLTITPIATNVTYVIQTSIMSSASINNANTSLVLFRDNVYLGGTLQIAASGGNSSTLSFSITDKPNTTNPITYQVRIGVTSGTWYVNQRTSELTYGGLQTGWVIWEY